MTHLKALPSPMPMLALPNYSYKQEADFVEETYLDTFLEELTVFISHRTTELRAETALIDQTVCKRFIADSARTPKTTFWSEVLEGASLAFNPFPLRKPVMRISDAEAIRSDWLMALADGNKVWHTIEVCIPETLKPAHGGRPRSAPSKAAQRTR